MPEFSDPSRSNGPAVLRRTVLASAFAAACAPTVQQARAPAPDFRGASFAGDRFVTFDGARLGLSTWAAEGEPWAVVVALHGMNDYAKAFHMAAPWWAAQGVTTYAYDQRGFGRSPQRGVWGGEELMMEDLRTAVAVARRLHPNAVVVVAGASMGGAVAISAFASDRPPDADRLLLFAPAVWGWSSQPFPQRALLWLTAHLAGDQALKPPSWVTKKIRASDNMKELRRMGRDPLMIFRTRTDAVYGLVRLMERAWASTGRLRVPTAYFYGANDQIVPKEPSFQAAARLPARHRTAYYEDGWHLLLRDLQAETVWEDALAFIREPHRPLPSQAPAIPGARDAGIRVSGL